MTLDELNGAVSKWQSVLRLRDWDVYATVCRRRDMTYENTGGEIDVQEKTQCAFLRLLDPVDMTTEVLALNDPEVIVVHELLHILTKPLGLPDDGPEQIAEEKLIHSISKALVALDRRSGESK